MLLIDASPLQVVMIVITSLIGIFGVAAGLSGFVYRTMNPLMRILIVVGGITLLIPGTMTDVIGLVIVVGVILIQRMGVKKQIAS